jgi:hypothetical protein
VRTRPEGESETHASFWLNFVLHQFIGVWGITMSAGVVTGLALDLLMLSGKHFTRGYLSWLLSGRPYFPIQIALAIFLGWVFGRHLWHKSMVWVWVMPFAILCYAFVAIPTITPTLPPQYQAGIGESRLSHYFGWGCGPWNYCRDQAAITLPFYIASAYSLGALFAESTSEWIGSNVVVERVLISLFGAWFFVAPLCDVYISSRGGWNWLFLPLGAVPAGIGALLMLLAIGMRAPRLEQR